MIPASVFCGIVPCVAFRSSAVLMATKQFHLFEAVLQLFLHGNINNIVGVEAA
jgi:hypothetical protein